MSHDGGLFVVRGMRGGPRHDSFRDLGNQGSAVQEWVQFFADLPSSVTALVGILIGSVITMVTGSLRDRTARALQQQRLDHESTQRVQERRSALRRDLYLKAIEGAAGMRQAVFSLLDPETDHRVVAESETATAGALSAVYLVAAPQTARAVSSYFLELQRVKAMLLMQRSEAVEAKAMQAHCLAQQQEAFARRGDLLRQQTDLIARGVGEHDAEWLILSSKIAAESGHLDFYGREVAKWLNAYRSALKPLFLSLIERMDSLEAAGLETLLCIRNELGVETDVSEFKGIYAKLSDDNKRFALDVMAKVDAVTEPLEEKA